MKIKKKKKYFFYIMHVWGAASAFLNKSPCEVEVGLQFCGIQ